VFDPARLGDRNWIEREITQMVDYVKASKPRPGVEEVLIAGEPELRSKAKRSAEGIPVDDTTWEQLLLAGEKVGLQREKMMGMV
jgi:uncharacterized oxidoreductase